MRSSRVILNGGVGNQLWQLAFAHKLIKARPVELLKIEKMKSEQNVHLESGAKVVAKIVSNCAHNLRFKTKDFQNLISKGKYVPESRFSRIFGRAIVDSRRLDYRDFNKINISSPYTHLGFYQSLKFLQDEVQTILDELELLFLERPIPRIFKNTRDYAVIHIRGGDYYSAKHVNIFGVLADQYYMHLVEELKSQGFKKIFVLTDDSLRARMRLEKINKLELEFVPKLDEISTLHIMSNAKVMCTANSSFSWWGGMLAARRGGKTFVPFPWFVSDTITSSATDPYDSNMIKVNAVFLDKQAFYQ